MGRPGYEATITMNHPSYTYLHKEAIWQGKVFAEIGNHHLSNLLQCVIDLLTQSINVSSEQQ